MPILMCQGYRTFCLSYNASQTALVRSHKKVSFCRNRGFCRASASCKTLLYDGIDVAYVSKPDVAFLYREIVEKRCYLQHGIYLPKGGTVVDIGANIGIFAAQAAREVSKSGRVIACEPLPATFAALECNMQNLLTPGMCIPCSSRCQK